MTVKATQFRQNLFQILDECYAKHEKVRIERGDEVFELIPRRKRMRIEDVPERPWMLIGDPDELHLVKTSEWDPDEEADLYDLP